MRQTHCKSFGMPALALMLLFLGACVQKPLVVPDQPQPPQPQPEIAQPQMPKIDPLADVPGDKPLPVAQGAVERIDCMNGEEDLHARMALEARGGRIESLPITASGNRVPALSILRAPHRVPNGA